MNDIPHLQAIIKRENRLEHWMNTVATKTTTTTKTATITVSKTTTKVTASKVSWVEKHISSHAMVEVALETWQWLQQRQQNNDNIDNENNENNNDILVMMHKFHLMDLKI